MTIKTITLGDQEFRVRPLVWKQLKIVEPAMGKLHGMKNTGMTTEGMESIGMIMLTAIQPEHPDMTQENLDDLPIKMPEMLAALSVIAEQAGMTIAKVPVPGEASGGSPSTTTA